MSTRSIIVIVTVFVLSIILTLAIMRDCVNGVFSSGPQKYESFAQYSNQAAAPGYKPEIWDLIKCVPSEYVVHYNQRVLDQDQRKIADIVEKQLRGLIDGIIDQAFQRAGYDNALIISAVKSFKTVQKRTDLKSQGFCHCGEWVGSISAELPAFVVYALQNGIGDRILASDQKVQDLFKSQNISLANVNGVDTRNININGFGTIPNTGDITIAVVDSGVDLTDNSVKSVLYKTDTPPSGCETDMIPTIGYDFVDNDNVPHESGGHGQKVVESILSTLTDAEKARVRIMPIRAFDNEGKSTSYRALCATLYAANLGADIINCSWGLLTSNAGIEGLHSLFTSATNGNDRAFVMAAGNDNKTLGAELNMPSGLMWNTSVLSSTTRRRINLASVNRVFEITGFTARSGQSQFTNHYTRQDARLNFNIDGCQSTGASGCGTSFSAGVFSGRLAKYRLANRTKTSQSVWDCLKRYRDNNNPPFVDVLGINCL